MPVHPDRPDGASAPPPEAAEHWAARASACHREGRLEEAVAAYRALVELRPDLAAAHSNLGVALKGLGRLDEAIAAYRRALVANPDHVEALVNLGEALLTSAADDALAVCGRAVALAPALPQAHNNLGVALQNSGRWGDAAAAFRRAVTLLPAYADAWFNLAVCERTRGAPTEAAAALAQAVVLRPDHAGTHLLLAATQADLGDGAAAEASCRQALALAPDLADGWFILGTALYRRGEHGEAAAALGRCLSLQPDHADAAANLGSALVALGRTDEAIAAYRHALGLAPGLAWLHHNLAMAYRKASDLDNEVAELRLAVDLAPSDADMHSALLGRLTCLPGLSVDSMAQEVDRWCRWHGQTHMPVVPLANSADPGRRLRIGYVCSYLDVIDPHPMGLWLQVLPMLENHDPTQVDITIYGGTPNRSSLERIWPLASNWRGLDGLDDDAAAEVIRSDGIDILVCLLGHTSGNRMTLFTRRPAPVQVIYSNIFASGVADMDYFIVDNCIHPPDSRERFSETPFVLPYFFSYAPLDWAPEVSPLPAATQGRITFGCFNVRAKIGERALAAFARVMLATPESRLVLKCRSGGYDSAASRTATQASFARHGVSPERIVFLPLVASARDHLTDYHRIDFALDPFPYQGCLTTFDALWMGVPTVALAGDRIAHRCGETLLHAAGLDELVVRTEEEYIAKVAAMASDLNGLAAWRATLRPRLARSQLCDGAAFTRTLEAAYREMWGRWCAQQS